MILKADGSMTENSFRNFLKIILDIKARIPKIGIKDREQKSTFRRSAKRVPGVVKGEEKGGTEDDLGVAESIRRL